MDYHYNRRVCVIGAGVSGLSACKHLLDQGFDPIVLEARGHIGGIWKTASFATTKLQTPHQIYQFSDFPWPQGTPLYPTARQALDYLQSYAKHFGLLDQIQFNTKVSSIRKKGSDLRDGNLGIWNEDERPWVVTVQKQDEEESLELEYEFDFIVLCLGRFGDVPNLPRFSEGEGPEVFKGKAIHTLEYCQMDMNSMAGKRVAVIGFAKSALDVAVEIAKLNQGTPTCSLVFRSPHWIAKEWKIFGLPLGFLYGNRFGEMLVPKPGQGFFSRAFTRMLFPLRWAISKVCEGYLRYTYPLGKYGLIPSLGFWQSLISCNIAVMPESFIQCLDKGHIKLHKSSDWHYYENGLSLNDNHEHVEADVVILATGFQGEMKVNWILPKHYAKALKDSGGSMSLYRRIVHPHIPNLAFVGYQDELSSLRVSEQAARWTAQLISGKFKLPDVKTMEKNANLWMKFMMSTAYNERPCIAAINTWHSDELCRDMGWNPNRKQGLLQNFFYPYSNLDYA